MTRRGGSQARALQQTIGEPGGLPGAKPERFCRWVADLLGYDADRDVLDDLFPGTRVMERVLSQGVLV